MAHAYARIMFSEAAKKFQQDHGSRASYERLAANGPDHDTLTASEQTFIAQRDSFYLASVSPDGWPYMQHRGGPAGLLHVLDPATLAFADFAGNKQYISAGNVSMDDRVALFLMDYPNQTRLKIIGHATLLEPEENPALTRLLTSPTYPARVERIVRIALAAFDWNCNQHIMPRYSAQEIEAISAHARQAAAE